MTDFINEMTSSKWVRLALIAVLVLLGVFLLSLALLKFKTLGEDTTYPAKTISVTADGRASAIPDVARVTYTIMERGASVKEAQEKVALRGNNALAAVKGLGIDEKDIRDAYYYVYPQYEYAECYEGPCAPPKIVGYEINKTVEVKVRDTAKASEVIGALGDLGVQSISGPEFGVDDPEVVRAEARAEAIADARAKAQELASQLGVKLGKVVSYSDDSMNPPYYGYGGDMASGKSAPVPELSPGQSEYNVQVTITYEINQGF